MSASLLLSANRTPFANKHTTANGECEATDRDRSRAVRAKATARTSVGREPGLEVPKREVQAQLDRQQPVARAVATEIEATARTFQQIRIEATHIANAHLLRALASRGAVPIPLLTRTFFERCVAGAGSSRRQSIDQALTHTIETYRQERSQVRPYRSPEITAWSVSKKEIAASMRSNAHTMIAHTFGRRLHAYVRSRCALSSSSARSLIKHAWDEGVSDDQLRHVRRGLE